MRTLTISCEYLARELREKDRDVRGWIEDYCKRNKIEICIIKRALDRNYFGPTENCLEIWFESSWQGAKFC